MSQIALPLTRRGKRLPKLPAVKEHVTHIAVVHHLEYFGRPDWEWTHPASGEHRDKRTAAKLKAMGTKPGWPDLIFVSPEGIFHGLELKREGTGRLSPAQRAFRDRCLERGWFYAVADNLNDALTVLRSWGVIPYEPNTGRAAA